MSMKEQRVGPGGPVLAAAFLLIGLVASPRRALCADPEPLPVPESIVADGVPAVPRALAEQLAGYGDIRQATFEDWLGGRREALILTRFAETNQVHRVTQPGGARQQLSFLTDRALGVTARPQHDQYLFWSDEGGAENYQFFVGAPPYGRNLRITDGRSRHVGPKWSHSGKMLAYTSNARNGKDMDVYVASPDERGSAKLVKEVSGDWHVADWSPDDTRIALLEYISINQSYVHVLTVATGALETLTPQDAKAPAPVSYANVKWSPDGKSLYWASDAGAEFKRLARYDFANKESRVRTANIPWDIEEFDISDDGRTLALVANEDGIARIHILDAGSGRPRLRMVPALPVGQITGLKFRPGTEELAFSVSSARASADVYSLDLARAPQLVRWTHSETGGLDPATFSEPELVHYKSFDGRMIPAFVYRPGSSAKFNGPRPVLIHIHGGPEGQYQPGFLGRLNELVSELGIVLIFPNVRGSAGYGKTYLKLDNGFAREDAVKDIGALLDWIGQERDLDAKRVAVMGGSYGGFMSLSTMTHYSDRLRAGIDVVGISNFLTFLKNTQSYRRDLRRAEYGDERDAKMHAFLEQVSPLSSAEKIKVPLLVAAGKNDPRVPVTESDQVVAKVRQNGVPVWYVVAKNEGHGFAKKPNQDYLQAVEVLFLKKYLLGEGE